MKSHTRRNALGLFGAAAVTVPFVAIAAVPDTDRQIIRTVDRLVANHAALDRLSDTRLTIADEHRTEAEYDALLDRSNNIVDELERLGPPTTLAGIRAIAQAALLYGPGRVDFDGERIATDPGEWLALVAMEQLQQLTA